MSLPTSTSAILYAPTDIRIEDRPIWAPSPGHVQIAIHSTGLCGSDLHYYTAGRNGDFAVRSPLVLGHESSGVITALGKGVSNSRPDLQVGMRVAVEAGVYCRNEQADCEYCEMGRYNLCKRMRFASSASRFPHLDGTLTTRMNHPAFVVHPIPDSVSFEQAALAEPLSVLIHASRRCGLSTWRQSQTFTSPGSVQPTIASTSSAVLSTGCTEGLLRPHPFPAPIPITLSPSASASSSSSTTASSSTTTPAPVPRQEGPTVLILGVGAIGLLASLLSKHLGASRVCAVDINRERLEWAEREGFVDEIYCLSPPGSSTSASASMGDPCCGSPLPSSHSMGAPQNLGSKFSTTGFSYTFECTGSPLSIQSSILSTLPGGKVCLIGMGARNVCVPISMAATREVDLVGVFRYVGCYGEGLGMLGEPAKSTTVPSALGGEDKTFGEMVSKLVTHRFELKDTKKAFEMLRRGVDEDGRLVLKVMVESQRS